MFAVLLDRTGHSSWQISHQGGNGPLWARGGKHLFYQWGHEGQVWVVEVRPSGGWSASKPRLLFTSPGFGGGDPVRSWDLSLDGQRFLMVKNEGMKPTPVTEMVPIQNWFEEVKRLASAGKN